LAGLISGAAMLVLLRSGQATTALLELPPEGLTHAQIQDLSRQLLGQNIASRY
jgi:glycerate-2-kinase